MSKEQQRRVALAAANTVRYAKADIKRAIRTLDRRGGMLLVADLFDYDTDHGFPEDGIEAMKFGEILSAIRWFGTGRTWDVARHVGLVSQDRQLRDMTNRQRCLVAEVLRNPSLVWPSVKVAA